MAISAGMIYFGRTVMKDPANSTVENIGPACTIAMGSFFFGISMLPWSSKTVE